MIPIYRKKTIVAVLLLFIIALFCGCKEDKSVTVSNIEDLYGIEDIIVGYSSVDGTLSTIEENFIDETLQPYDDMLLGLNALQSQKIDTYISGKFFIERDINESNITDLKILDGSLMSFQVALGLSESAPVENYVDRVNECIEKLISDGTIDEMKTRWFIDGNDEIPEIVMPKNPVYTLRVATFGACKPYSFIKDNELSGFDIELAYRVASYLGCDLVLETMEYPSMTLGLSAGKYDMISANLYISDERKENLVFSVPYSSNDICAVVRSSWTESGGADEDSSPVFSVFGEIKKGIERTFITEGRWKMILSGLAVTITITFYGFITANIFGIIFCYFTLSDSKILKKAADIYSRIMQGTPIVVILLIMFYIVLGNTSVSGIFAAILGFGLSSGSSLALLFSGAISSVQKGQTEAALSLGFSKFGAFTGIVLPQAIRRLLPGYFSELIGLMKGTAIAGYVAVTDLTKVSDMIRSSTYDAFYPLISVAIIYFTISYILLNILKRLQKHLAPKRVTKEEVEK